VSNPNQNKPSQPQIKPIVPPKEIVWMSCRAGCGGNQAYVSMIFRTPLASGGGTVYRYRCTSCNGVWTVNR